MKRVKKITWGLGVLFIGFLLSPLWLMPGDEALDDLENPQHYAVALVFGAGLNGSGRPSDVLSDRLITAADLYFAGRVDKILVSGDNSREEYDEPTAMRDFLVTWGVPEEDIALDFAGRRTYDTCYRAKNIWNVESALLVTQDFHLPRALFLCNQFGIESAGVSASRQPYVRESYFAKREKLAVYKAILDVYVLHPKPLGGPKEEL